ncbi:MAG: hypothetical protein LBR12_06325 [Opitutaceae bacterium]|jgi:hypothetical protein|nr:hypothetical protein [Opitutaceae bacterium]
MWLCTRHGVFSIVRKKAGEIHVRARCRKDLEALCDAAALDQSKIIRTYPADYRWRLVVGQAQYEILMDAIVASLDYPNFKPVIAGTPAQRDKLPVYFGFHADMERWQDERETLRRR